MKTTIDSILAGLVTLSVLVAFAIMVGTARGVVPLEAQSAAIRNPIACDQSVAVSTAAISTLQVVALTAGQRIHVCSFVLNAAGVTTAKFVRGTGANCAGAPADLSGAMKFVDSTSIPHGSGLGTVMRLPVGEALCVTNSAAIQLSGVITFAKF